MPIYEYRCEACGKRSSTLLGSFASPDPPCPYCGKPALKRLISTFATVTSSESFSGESEGDAYDQHEHDHEEWGGGDGDFDGGDDFGDDDF